jgi:hypothetical protein
MTLKEMANLLEAKPFLPFRMYAGDGYGYEVRQPDAIRIAGGLAVVFARKIDRPSAFVYDRFDIVSLSYIVRVETLPPAAQATNGA